MTEHTELAPAPARAPARTWEDTAQAIATALLGMYVIVGSVAPYLYGTWLAVAVVLALGLLVISHRELSLVALMWLAALLAVGLLGLLVGTLNDNPGAVPTITIFIIEPLVIGSAFVLMLQHRRGLARVVLMLDLAVVAVVLVAAGLYTTWAAGTEMPAWLVDPAYSTIDMADGTPRTNYQGFNGFVFLAAYGTARLFWKIDPAELWWWRYAMASCAIIGIVLSGRRILFIAVPLVLCLVWLLMHLRRSGRDKQGRGLRVVAGALVLVVSGGLVVWFTSLRHFVRTLFTVQSAEGPVDPRLGQHMEILAAWWKSPLWGQGAGNVIPGYQRSEDFPWVFELSYHVLLMNFGIVGFLVLAAWTGWIAWRLSNRLVECDASAPLLAGYLAAILATATNPYLFKIEGLWMVMIPFGVACLGSRRVGLTK